MEVSDEIGPLYGDEVPVDVVPPMPLFTVFELVPVVIDERLVE